MIITANALVAINGINNQEYKNMEIRREIAHELAQHILDNFSQYITTEGIVDEQYGAGYIEAKLTVDVQSHPGDNTGGIVGGGYNLEINTDGRVIDIQEDEPEEFNVL